MQAYRLHVVVPMDRRLTIELPETVPAGPVELIVLVPQQEEQSEVPPQGRGSLAALAAELARDPKPFRDLTPEERRARLRRLRGAGRGLTSGSEDFVRRKHEE